MQPPPLPSEHDLTFAALRADGSITTARNLTQVLKRYREVCNEMEFLKQALTGSPTTPVPCRQWEAWKAQRCCPTLHRPVYIDPCRKLSDDPRYQRLLDLSEESFHLQSVLDSDEFFRDGNALIREVVRSFPSLRDTVDPSYVDMSLLTIIGAGEITNPQAYHAAVFVDVLQTVGVFRQQPDSKFYLDRAFEVWDDAHKEAFFHWVTMPFFPNEFRHVSVKPPLL